MSKKLKSPMDGFHKPSGYRAPTSSEELLERYEKGERYFVGARLDKANLIREKLNSANFERGSFRGAKFDGANLDGAIFGGARFDDASVYDAYLGRSSFQDAILQRANLTGTILEGANLHEANLREADLSDVRFTFTNLANADFNGAVLRNTDFAMANCRLTVFADNDLRAAKNLGKIVFGGPCHISTSTLMLSHGAIPDSFLRGCGLAEWETKTAKLYNPELDSQTRTDLLYAISNLQDDLPIQNNPLFISYCHSDSAFVDAVSAIFDSKGIRYWRDIHDAKSGRLEKQLDRAIRMNPTVLLVLSKNSVRSDWVRWETSRARELENELDRDILCPVALDDSWKTSKWPGHLRQQIKDYNILDFSEWEDEKLMERQFKKLLDGLALFYKPGKKDKE